VACATSLRAQGVAGHQPSPAPPSGIPATAQGIPAEPQVLTVVHRLSGLKVLRLMRRTGAQVAELDKGFIEARDSHTTVTAGLALADGHSVVARLDQAEVEVDEATAPTDSPEKTAEPVLADLAVVGRNGQQFAARYVGLDGSTGLSILQVDGLTIPSMPLANEEQFQVGQRVRLFAPEPASRAGGGTASGTLYLRVGEMTGQVASITRTASGHVARLVVRASNLTRALVGGLALNDAGEVIGIVESSREGEARIIPSATARSAAERVMARHGSVPRPWLGVRGHELSTASVAELVAAGWKRAKAAALVSRGSGVLLTSVGPATPAALAGLHVGDVITSVNGQEVKDAQDFSLMLEEAGGGGSVRLSVLRPDALAPLTVTAKLEESLTPAVATEVAEARAGHAPSPDPFITHGAETIMLSQKAAANLGAPEGGRLVVFVEPLSAAARADLRAGDLIESIDGRLISETGSRPATILNNPSTHTLGVVREGQKIRINLQ
jgi:S1-C subfamily serine protease